MKSQKLQDAVGRIDPSLIARAAKPPRFGRVRRSFVRVAGVAALLAVSILVGHLLGAPMRGVPGYALSVAEYPVMAPYPGKGEYDKNAQEAWLASMQAQRQYNGRGADLDAFFSAAMRAFLPDADGENTVFSPLNIYFVLATLAEMDDGESRTQILSLLGCDDMDALRTKTHAIWNANYRDDGLVTSIPATSVWLSEGMSYSDRTIENLKTYYYASVYRGKMGASDYDSVLNDWIREQSRGTLANGDGFSSQTQMALVTSLYFQTTWVNRFLLQNTEVGIFHGTKEDTSCEFMRQQLTDTYYDGETFSATYLPLNEGAVCFLLPDEGQTVESCLLQGEMQNFLFGNVDTVSRYRAKIQYAIPKFDVSSTTDLREGIAQMGVRAPLSTAVVKGHDAAVTEIRHSACVKIDENGVEGASVTISHYGEGVPPLEIVSFVLDRPFLFVVLGCDGLPLFVGVVNQI